MTFRPRILSILLIALVLLAACADAPPDGLPTPESVATPAPLYPVSVVDASGQTVMLDAAPQRIVSASLAADEVLLSLVDADRLVAISHRADDEAVSNLVGLAELDGIERLPAQPAAADIAAFQPDLAIVPDDMDSGVVGDLREQDVAVYVYAAPLTLAELDVALAVLGMLTGESERAAGLVDGVAARIAEIQRQIGETGDPLPSVLYYVGDGRVAGSGTVPDQIIRLAGGVNAAADLDGWATVTDADVIALNPTRIITPPGQIDDTVEDNPAFAGLAALENGPVVPLSDPEMLAQSQYMVRGVLAVAKILYPDRVEG